MSAGALKPPQLAAVVAPVCIAGLAVAAAAAVDIASTPPQRLGAGAR